MSNTDYEQKLNELKHRVNNYVKTPSDGVFSSISNINLKSPILYIIIPIVVLFLLFIFRPSFICSDHIEKDNITKKLNYKTLLIISVITGVTIDIAIFAYFRNKI